MALDFPSSPTNGQSYNGWIYNSAKSAWQTAATGVMMTVSTTAPSSPKVGDQWYNLNNGLRFTWVNDGTSSQWVQDYAPVANDSVYDTRITALETGVRTVPLGGTGAATLTGYVKGNGTSAFTAQTTPIPVADGGTGATTLTGYAKGSGTSAFSAVTTIPVADGGTGATSLASGDYLKGAGTSAITTQNGIPGSDITSGTINRNRLPTANWAISNATATTVSSTTPTTIASLSLTTRGNPVFLCGTGDLNPNGAATWNYIRLYRDSTAIGKYIICESTANSVNNPFALTFIDSPAAGTYTYTIKAWQGGATAALYGETSADQAPQLVAFELF